MMIVQDQLDQILDFEKAPERVVSVVPSQTELLHFMGLDESVIGITKFCVHPNEWYKFKTRVGGTKNLNISKIKNLKPDFVLANQEENTKEDIDAISQICNVYTSSIYNFKDAYKMIEDVGIIFQKKHESLLLIDQLKSDLEDRQITSSIRSAYLIWHKPYMTISSNTFIHFLLNHFGFKNVFAGIGDSRYPEISIEQLIDAKPEIVFLSSEPYPFKNKHVKELKKQLIGANVLLVDGELFSWYGPRLLHTSKYVKTLKENL